MSKHILVYVTALLMISTASCRKLIKISPPLNTLVTSEVFQTPEQSLQVLAGIYYTMVNDVNSFAAGRITYYAGLSSDEFQLYNPDIQNAAQFYNNDIQPINAVVGNIFWGTAYKLIFQANSLIENIPNTAFKDSVKNELLGQALFVRAFLNFYLVNLFGDIPLVQTSNWQSTRLMARSPGSEVYQSIISDLKFAADHLSGRFGGERVLPNAYAAKALLARVYLYNKNWQEAETLASDVIAETGLFALVDAKNIFAPNNKEAIWQLKQQSLQANLFKSPEGSLFIPRVKNNANYPPIVYFYKEFINSFDSADARRKNWIDSTKLNAGSPALYYPYKYKTGDAQTGTGYTEYHTPLRLAEQFLIRAEARLRQQNISGAIEDLNIIRNRSSLVPLPQGLGIADVEMYLVAERKKELFAEWGHRWLDLKRWNMVNAVMQDLKNEKWQPYDQWYPLPEKEIMTNPNLTQNEGY